MSRTIPLEFQLRQVDQLLARFRALKTQYDALGATPPPAELTRLRQQGACVLLQAPTGIGKTLMACELMARFSPEDKLLWLWFAPFTGVLSQAEGTLRRQAPVLNQLDIDSDRQLDKLTPGSSFVLSWQTVATRSREARLVRQDGDAGLSVDELLAQARHAGFRVAVVVDEAHHGFVRATEAGRCFADVIAPDYVLLMTATPRDADAARFAQQTGYRIGGQEEWASISRKEGVDAELLKTSVKAARFIAPNANDAQLVAFEEVALSECAVMHRRIKQTLADAGVPLTPLMLVQVPNGGAALDKAKQYLVQTLRFGADAVRSHTADEPDPNLAALAADPQVEVILFKMAIATGFDAPRAFTLAALRGTRDAEFGVQVVGRIMRVHRLLQGRRAQLPALLQYGYVFLANSAAQEGLLQAAARINQMPEQLAAATPSVVVTVFADESAVQVFKPGQSLSLLPPQALDGTAPLPTGAGTGTSLGPTAHPVSQPQQESIFQVLAAQGVVGDHHGLAHGLAEQTPLSQAFELDAQVADALVYPLREGVPRSFITEYMPPVPENFEERLAAHIDFARVLGDRTRTRMRVIERTTDVFVADAPQDLDVWAQVSAAAIAERARQIAFAFDDVDRRELLKALKARFREALVSEGHELPTTDEELTRQLELVLVRNDRLIRDAHKRLRSEQVREAPVHLSPTLVADGPLAPAARNVYGVFPDNMSPQERAFAEQLDTSQQVLWWHRNSVRKADSVGLYRWAEGVGFFPDFVVGVAERTEGEGVALSEVKGPQLQQYDKAKAAAAHMVYGRVFMVGKTGADGDFRLWRLAGENLVDDGPFEVQRLRYS